MRITDCKIEGIKLIEPRVFEDDRGYFFESFRDSIFKDTGIGVEFVQDNVSKSCQNTVRGLHYQIKSPQDKLVTCLKGTIIDVAVDIRKESPTFGQHLAFELSDENHRLLLIPKGFAHGFSVLSKEAIISYKCSDYYNPDGERGIRWDDPSVQINWRVNNPILSDKDKILPLLSLTREEDLF
tara:strand:- start:7890 stop:8435 length:546 start_codon:yes stop_codon:yes gene_type:complete